MGKRVTILIALFILVITVGCIAVYRFIESERIENERYDRGETELIVVNTTDSQTSLYRAGRTLDEAELVADFDGQRKWLSEGAYFLKLERDPAIFYPISILGYRQGNQDDGSFALTIREPSDKPPDLPPDSGPFLPVPSGDFLFGDRANPAEPHFVWTQAFYIGAYEVTNAEYLEFLDAEDGFADDSNWTEDGRQWKRRTGSSASSKIAAGDPEFARFGQPDMPVTDVGWFEAVAYCRWLTKRLGAGAWIYSLPTEAEWEKAARGPDSFDYGLGNSLSDAETPLYNWKKNPSAETTVVGIAQTPQRYKANRYGLYHMGGNVAEWTESLYRPFNQVKPYSDDERNRTDLPGQRVVRGGSWYSASNALMYLAYRDAFTPELRHDDLGFRVVARRIP